MAAAAPAKLRRLQCWNGVVAAVAFAIHGPKVPWKALESAFINDVIGLHRAAVGIATQLAGLTKQPLGSLNEVMY